MLYMLHHYNIGQSPALVGEGAPDMIACRFDVSLGEMIELARGVAARRLLVYGLATERLAISERGRKVVFTIDENGDELHSP